MSRLKKVCGLRKRATRKKCRHDQHRLEKRREVVQRGTLAGKRGCDGKPRCKAPEKKGEEAHRPLHRSNDPLCKSRGKSPRDSSARSRRFDAREKKNLVKKGAGLGIRSTQMKIGGALHRQRGTRGVSSGKNLATQERGRLDCGYEMGGAAH